MRTPLGLITMLMAPSQMSYDCPGCQLKFNAAINETIKLLQAAEKKALRLQKHSAKNHSTNRQNCSWRSESLRDWELLRMRAGRRRPKLQNNIQIISWKINPSSFLLPMSKLALFLNINKEGWVFNRLRLRLIYLVQKCFSSTSLGLCAWVCVCAPESCWSFVWAWVCAWAWVSALLLCAIIIGLSCTPKFLKTCSNSACS